MRLLRLVLPILFMLPLIACQSSLTGSADNSSSAPMRLQRILDSGELRIGLSGNQPPLNMTDKNGEIIGLEVDLMKARAQTHRLSKRLDQVDFEADDLSALVDHVEWGLVARQPDPQLSTVEDALQPHRSGRRIVGTARQRRLTGNLRQHEQDGKE